MDSINIVEEINTTDRRFYNRFAFKDHPVILTKHDGTAIQGLTSDLSLWGVKVMINSLCAHLITPILGTTENGVPSIDIAMTLPCGSGNLNIEAQCMVVHLGIDMTRDSRFNHFLGLHIVRHKGDGKKAVSKILYGQEVFIPH